MPERIRKRFLYLMRQPPHGSIFAQEGLETVLIGAAFEQSVSLLFLDDGVFVLKRGQAPEGVGLKDFASAASARFPTTTSSTSTSRTDRSRSAGSPPPTSSWTWKP